MVRADRDRRQATVVGAPHNEHMLLHRIVAASTAVSATRSRLAKRAVLAEVLAAAEPDDIHVVVSYLAGELRQRRTGVG